MTRDAGEDRPMTPFEAGREYAKTIPPPKVSDATAALVARILREGQAKVADREGDGPPSE